MAVTYQHFLLVGLLVALSGLAYAENAGPPPVPRFEPAPCPKLPGADELAKAGCGYLVVPENRSRPSGSTIRLMVAKYPARSPEKRADPILVSRSSFADMYWTFAQMLAHHTSTGCNLRTGDLLGSGTVSGKTPESRGCLLERPWRGSEPLKMPDGSDRSFLADGDEVIIRGECSKQGFRRIGLGECRGTITAAVAK